MFFATAPPCRFELFQQVSFQLEAVSTASTLQTTKVSVVPKGCVKSKAIFASQKQQEKRTIKKYIFLLLIFVLCSRERTNDARCILAENALCRIVKKCNAFF